MMWLQNPHGGLQFIKYHIKHSRLLYMFCYPALVGTMHCLLCFYFPLEGLLSVPHKIQKVLLNWAFLNETVDMKFCICQKTDFVMMLHVLYK